MSEDRYFTATDYMPSAVLRRVAGVDEAFVDGAWRPTEAIWEWQFGHNDFVTEITEAEARVFAPAAFA